MYKKDQEIDHWLQRIQISEGAFASDVDITPGNDEDLQENLEIWNNVLQKYGMKLNKDKTKVMAVGTSHETNKYLENIRILHSIIWKKS